ncbi:hypothetical protein SEPCBS119000_004257 [Sporothrix epigloea]|uniref:Sulfite reductase beta subunit n=1 Tax=Sporothrix epigloea TaxID=1892477 RepID=A0ABP0DR45_9PEZI
MSVDPDPVVARYNVFLKPQLPAHQKLLVLQYPNRVDKSSAGGAGAITFSGQTPTELRIKADSGMVEVDVPLDYTSAYDRAKGIAWGSALATSTKAKAGGSHGLAGGFGVGGTQGNTRTGGAGGGRAAAAQADMEGQATTSSTDWSEAVRQDRVLRLQTLGGMCPPARIAEAKWMIGVFEGGNLHLTPVSSLVHLRPQLHHIDAETEVERAKHRDTASGGGAGGDGAGAGRPGGPGGPRAIHMTVKSVGADGDEFITETMADRLRAVQMENWARMQYVGDDDETSWEAYDQALFLRDTAAALSRDAGATEEDLRKMTAEEGGSSGGQKAQLVTKVPSLRTDWTECDMLQAISGIEKPSEELAPAKTPMTSQAAVKGKGKASTAASETASIAATRTPSSTKIKAEQDANPPPLAAERRTRTSVQADASLPAGATNAPSRGRGGRARQAGSTRGSAMDLD